VPDANQLEFVARIFPGVPRAKLHGLADRVTRLELEPGFVSLRQQAAMCIERGVLESGRRTKGEWKAFWVSKPGTVLNTDAIFRKTKGVGVMRATKRTTLLLLTADAFEAELEGNRDLAKRLGI
jgi:hypothetical protein